MRRSVALLFLLATAGCEEDVGSNITMALPDGVTPWPMDINPDSAFPGIDNTVSVDVTFAETVTGLSRSLEWSEYEIEYGLAGEVAPPLVGVLEATLVEGGTITLRLEGLGDPQIDWVSDRYQGGNLLVPFRVTLTGVLDGFQGVIVYEEFTAVFSDPQ